MTRFPTRAMLSLAPALSMLSGCAIAPQPLDSEQILGLSHQRVHAVAATVPAQNLILSLHEAIAHAVKFNFDHHVESFQVALRSAEARNARASGLPAVLANAAYVSRSNELAKGSLELIPPPAPLPAESGPDSVSSETDVDTRDLSLSWNLLDFALSYVRAEQGADRVLIASEQRRRIVQRLIEDTRTAYWRALSHQRFSEKLARLDERAVRAIQRTKRAAREGAETPMTALAYERELTQIRQTAEKLQHELALSRSQLAALMNIPPGVSFRLTDMAEQHDPHVTSLGVEAMIAEAMFNRPEIREIAYQSRINQREVTAAVVDVLPSLRLTLGSYASGDHFLHHKDWTSIGIAAAGNLLKIVQLPARRAAIEAEGELLRAKALAMTLAVITQVHVSRIRYHHSHELLDTARRYAEVQQQLVQHIRAEKAADLIGEQTLIREEMNLVVSEVQVDIAIASVLGANSNLMTTLGYDMQGRDLDLTLDIGPIATQIKANWQNRTAVSDRAVYLAEIAKAQAEAKRHAAEEERKRKERVALERAEQARLAKLAAAEAAAERKAATARLANEAAERRRSVAKPGKRHSAPATRQNTTPIPFWPFGDVPAPKPEPQRPVRIYTGTK